MLAAAFVALWLTGLIVYLPGRPHYHGVSWWTPVGFVVIPLLAIGMSRGRIWAAITAAILMLGVLYIDTHLIVVDYGATPRTVSSATVDSLMFVVVLMIVFVTTRRSRRA